jgi:hypothetical protein
MSFSSYIARGLQLGSMCSDDNSSHYSIMDFFQGFPLCCRDTEAVEAIFRPPIDTTDSDREEITHGNKIMEKPWRPPLYRDTSLLAAPRDVEEESQPPLSSPKTITPSIGVVSYNDSIPSQKHISSNPRSVIKTNEDVTLPPTFVPPTNYFPRRRSFEFEVFSRQDQNNHPNPSVDEDSLSHSYSKSQSSSSTTNLRLEPKDVVCGRGAPTSIYPGNLVFKKTIKKHEMTYLCSTRSEKPKIAMKLLEEFSTRGVRFVKRERNNDGGFVWVEIGEQRCYEKICQSLREGAPQLRRQLMATEAKQMKKAKDKKSQLDRSGNRHYQRRQTRQDSETKFFGMTPTIVCEMSNLRTSSFSTVKTTNVDRYDPIGEQNSRKIKWLDYHDHSSKDNIYDNGKHFDFPYSVHLPPHLGGERLFRDRIE